MQWDTEGERSDRIMPFKTFHSYLKHVFSFKISDGCWFFNRFVCLSFPPKKSEPPSFVVVPEPQAVVPNTTVRFKSTFKGTPPFTVKWFREDTELITGPSCFIGLEGLSCFIDLYAVGLSNTGTYSCQVSNDAGTVKCTTNLLVKGLILLSYALLPPPSLLLCFTFVYFLLTSYVVCGVFTIILLVSMVCFLVTFYVVCGFSTIILLVSIIHQHASLFW